MGGLVRHMSGQHLRHEIEALVELMMARVRRCPPVETVGFDCGFGSWRQQVWLGLGFAARGQGWVGAS